MERVLAHLSMQLICTVSEVSWVCMGPSLGKTDPIFIFSALLTGLGPHWLFSIPTLGTPTGPA